MCDNCESKERMTEKPEKPLRGWKEAPGRVLGGLARAGGPEARRLGRLSEATLQKGWKMVSEALRV